MSKRILDIVIPYRDNGDGYRNRIHEWHRQRLHYLFPASYIITADSEHEQFNRSAARNRGVQRSEAKYVALVDSDTAFNADALLNGLKKVMDGAPWSIPYNLYVRTDRKSGAQILGEDPKRLVLAHHNYNYDFQLDFPPTRHEAPISGLLIFRRDDFLDIGGYSEDFTGWGYEDRALVVVADRLLGAHVRCDGIVYHLWHPEPTSQTWNQSFINTNKQLYQKICQTHDPAELRKLNGGVLE